MLRNNRRCADSDDAKGLIVSSLQPAAANTRENSRLYRMMRIFRICIACINECERVSAQVLTLILSLCLIVSREKSALVSFMRRKNNVVINPQRNRARYCFFFNIKILA